MTEVHRSAAYFAFRAEVARSSSRAERAFLNVEDAGHTDLFTWLEQQPEPRATDVDEVGVLPVLVWNAERSEWRHGAILGPVPPKHWQSIDQVAVMHLGVPAWVERMPAYLTRPTPTPGPWPRKFVRDAIDLARRIEFGTASGSGRDDVTAARIRRLHKNAAELQRYGSGQPAKRWRPDPPEPAPALVWLTAAHRAQLGIGE